MTDDDAASALGSSWDAELVAEVGAAIKHYAADNQETDRHRVSADVDERTLREIYLPALNTTSPRHSRGR